MQVLTRERPAVGEWVTAGMPGELIWNGMMVHQVLGFSILFALAGVMQIQRAGDLREVQRLSKIIETLSLPVPVKVADEKKG